MAYGDTANEIPRLAGKYYVWGDREILTTSLYGEILSPKATADILLANIDFASRVLVIDVEDHELALVYRNGNFVTVLFQGRHVYWNEDNAYAVRMIDRTEPMVPEDLPAPVLQRLTINHKVCRAEEVTEYQKGLLFVNRQFVRILEPGAYYFWNNGMFVQVRTVDTRLLQLDVNGQEMLTKDKVTIRVNLVCHYRIREYEKILLEVDDYEEQLHLAAQTLFDGGGNVGHSLNHFHPGYFDQGLAGQTSGGISGGNYDENGLGHRKKTGGFLCVYTIASVTACHEEKHKLRLWGSSLLDISPRMSLE